MIGSFVTSLRPDRAFSATPVNTPKELFKGQYVNHPSPLVRRSILKCWEAYRSLYCYRTDTGACSAQQRFPLGSRRGHKRRRRRQKFAATVTPHHPIFVLLFTDTRDIDFFLPRNWLC
jgi:hypothetical protein